MTAKEMFEELGYEISTKPGYIYYDGGDDRHITFVTFDKSVIIAGVEYHAYDSDGDDYYPTDYHYEPVTVRYDVICAVKKQMEELGWD